MPEWFHELLSLGLRLPYAQQLGLAFLLGSFAVATWSDLKYLAAQREFLEVWGFLALSGLGYDLWRVHAGELGGWAALLKWGLLGGLCLASWRPVGWLFRLAAGDVAALAAAGALLPPLHIGLLFAAAKGASYGLGPLLRRGNVYPFMPVVCIATVAVLLAGLLA